MFTPYLKYFIRKTSAPIEPNTTRQIYDLLSRCEPMMFRPGDDAYAEWKSCTLAEFEQMKEHYDAGGFIADKVGVGPENISTLIADTEARADFVRWI